MKKYLAKLMFNISIDNGQDKSEFDEQVRVISSVSYEDALFKARTIGKREETTFRTQKQNEINWKFIDVSELYSLNEAEDGTQLFSQTHKTSDADSYIRYIRQKSIEIQTKSLTFA